MTTRRVVAVAIAMVASILFAAYNRGQPIVLSLGPLSWRVDAVIALYVAGGTGMVAMFILGVIADRARRDTPD